MFVAAAVVVLTFFKLNRFHTDSPTMGQDGSVWVDMARDCVELGHCHVTGANSSVQLDTGAAWTYFLMAGQLLHSSSVGDLVAVLVLLSVGVGTVFLVCWRWLGFAVAAGSTMTVAMWLAWWRDPWLLWNTSTVFFPDAMYCAALLVFAWTGRFAPLAFAALFLAVALHVHLGALLLAPSLVALPIMAGARPARATLFGVGACLVAYSLVAPGSFVLNVSWAAESGAAAMLSAVVGGLIVTAALARRWFQPAGRDGRAAMTLVAMLAAWLPAMQLIARTRPGRLKISVYMLRDTYGIAGLEPAAVLGILLVLWLATTAGRRLRLRPRGLTVVRGIVTLMWAHSFWTPAPDVGVWHEMSREDARKTIGYLEQAGWDYEHLVEHVQSPGCQNTLAGLLMYAGPPTPPPPSYDPATQVRLWVLHKEDLPEVLPPDMKVLPLRQGRVLVSSALKSWLNPSGIQYCEPVAADGHLENCVPTHVPVAITEPHEFLFSRRGGSDSGYPAGTHPDADEALVIPLVTTGETRSFFLTPHDCPWTFGPVDGLSAEMTPDRLGVRIKGAAGATGTMTVIKRGSACPLHPLQPPCIMEMRSGDPTVLNEKDLTW